MQKRGWKNTPARTQQAALYTRRRKAEPDRQVLQKTWQERAREIGPARDRDMARGRKAVHVSASPAPRSRELPSALSVVRRAVEHLEERHTVFSANDLRAWALAHGAGRHSLEALDAGIAQLQRDGHLIEAKTRRAGLDFVTDRALNAERDIIAGMRASLDAGHKPGAGGCGRGRTGGGPTEPGPARCGTHDPALAPPHGGGAGPCGLRQDDHDSRGERACGRASNHRPGPVGERCPCAGG